MNRTEQEQSRKQGEARASLPIDRPPDPPENFHAKNEAADKRYRLITKIVIGLLLVIIAFETFIILEQRRVTQQVEAQSAKAYGRFLQQGKAPAGSAGSNILLRNVQYCWSSAICIDTERLSATAVSLSGGNDIVFDDIKSFIVKVHNGRVRISPQTLQGMFNESVFNYPGSNLRNLTVTIREAGQENRVKLAGSLKYFLWIPFEMDTNLKVDQSTNTLVISVYKLKVFGFIPATWLIELRPFNLQKLLTLPQNRYLTVRENLMMVKPFGLFPPPRIDGKMAGITVMPRLIELRFAGSEPAIASGAAANSISLKNGNAQFGRIRLLGADVEVNDRNPGDRFRFSLLNYLSYLPQSHVKLQKNGGVTLQMPDLGRIPDLGASVYSPENDARLQQKKGVGKDSTSKAEDADKPSLWERTKAKVKGWLKIGD